MTTIGDQIRSLRARRGWTQLEVAQNIDRLAWSQQGRHVGVNADMVAKWERGVKTPSRRYQELLDILVEASSAPGTVVPVRNDPVPPAIDPIGGVLAQAELLLDGLGGDAHILKPRLLEIWGSEVMRRRALLKMFTLAPAIALLPCPDPTLRATAENAALLGRLADEYQRLYHRTAPSLLIAPVVAHLDTTRGLLAAAGSESLRRRLLVNQAQVALLAGRISFFDLNDAIGARGYLGLSTESALEAGDRHLKAAAIAHTAFISAAEGRAGTAVQHLEHADATLQHDPHRNLSAWIAAVGSEVAANRGATSDSLAFIDRARSCLLHAGLSRELPWFDFFDESRLDGFAGYANLRAHRSDDAEALLTRTRDSLPDAAVKQRAVVLADLATVHLARGDLDQACSVASDAADGLRQAGYATGLDRLRVLRSRMAPWAAATPVRELDQHLALAA